MSIEELDNITPVKPPKVKRNTNPTLQREEIFILFLAPQKVASHLKILIPVGTAIIMVAEVKYARVSTSIPIVNM